MRALRVRMKILVVAGALTVAIVSIAYAYWTATGSGTGSVANATTNGTIVLHAAFAAGLTPGASETVTYTADNAGTSSLYVNTITPTVSIDTLHGLAGCLVGDFTIPTTASGTTVGPGLSGVAAGSGTLTFADTTANQDPCQGATVTLALTSN